MLRAMRIYQREAMRFLISRKRAALFMEMRLGKTLVVLRSLRRVNANPILIVAPFSALGSWEGELASEGMLGAVNLCGKDRKKRLQALTDGLNQGSLFFLINREGH